LGKVNILRALNGIGGEPEIQRILGALGTLTYTIAVPAFVTFGKFGPVSTTEFCIAYPAGLAACIGATAGAIALKDRQVANAKLTEKEAK
jgi:hypothetical protein